MPTAPNQKSDQQILARLQSWPTSHFKENWIRQHAQSRKNLRELPSIEEAEEILREPTQPPKPRPFGLLRRFARSAGKKDGQDS